MNDENDEFGIWDDDASAHRPALWLGFLGWLACLALAAALVFLLAACAAQAPRGGLAAAVAAGPDLAPHAGTLRTLTVLMKLDTATRTEAACADAGAPRGAVGCATWFAKSRLCTVRLPLPESAGDAVWQEAAFHEFVHCQNGHFHP